MAIKKKKKDVDYTKLTSALVSLRESFIKEKEGLLKLLDSPRADVYPEDKAYRTQWAGNRGDIIKLLGNLLLKIDLTNELLGVCSINLIEINDKIPTNLEVLLTQLVDNTNCACEALQNMQPQPETIFTFSDDSVYQDTDYDKEGTAAWCSIKSTSNGNDTGYTFLDVPEWLENCSVNPLNNGFNYTVKPNLNNLESREGIIKLVQDVSNKVIRLRIFQRADTSVFTFEDGTLEHTVTLPYLNTTDYVVVPMVSFRDGDTESFLVSDSSAPRPDWVGNPLGVPDHQGVKFKVTINNGVLRECVITFVQRLTRKEIFLKIVQEKKAEFRTQKYFNTPNTVPYGKDLIFILRNGDSSTSSILDETFLEGSSWGVVSNLNLIGTILPRYYFSIEVVDNLIDSITILSHSNNLTIISNNNNVITGYYVPNGELVIEIEPL